MLLFGEMAVGPVISANIPTVSIFCHQTNPFQVCPTRADLHSLLVRHQILACASAQNTTVSIFAPSQFQFIHSPSHCLLNVNANNSGPTELFQTPPFNCGVNFRYIWDVSMCWIRFRFVCVLSWHSVCEPLCRLGPWDKTMYFKFTLGGTVTIYLGREFWGS